MMFTLMFQTQGIHLFKSNVIDWVTELTVKGKHFCDALTLFAKTCIFFSLKNILNRNNQFFSYILKIY